MMLSTVTLNVEWFILPLLNEKYELKKFIHLIILHSFTSCT